MCGSPGAGPSDEVSLAGERRSQTRQSRPHPDPLPLGGEGAAGIPTCWPHPPLSRPGEARFTAQTRRTPRKPVLELNQNPKPVVSSLRDSSAISAFSAVKRVLRSRTALTAERAEDAENRTPAPPRTHRRGRRTRRDSGFRTLKLVAAGVLRVLGALGGTSSGFGGCFGVLGGTQALGLIQRSPCCIRKNGGGSA